MGMNERPFLSVIVPVWNGAAQIGSCLEALADQTYPSDRFEILVVDNGSTDQTAEAVCHFPQVILLKELTQGSYSARNRGLATARGEFVAFTDADCIPSKDWLDCGVRALLGADNVGIVGGRIELFGNEGDSPTCRAFEEMFSLNQAHYIRSGHCTTANWMSRLGLIRELGGFNSSLRSGGDVELSGRIAAAGFALTYVECMVVRHPMRGNVADLVRKNRRLVGGHWTMRATVSRRLRYVASLGRQLLQSWRRAWATKNLSIAMRIRLSLLLGLFLLVSLFEITRLSMGGTARCA